MSLTLNTEQLTSLEILRDTGRYADAYDLLTAVWADSPKNADEQMVAW